MKKDSQKSTRRTATCPQCRGVMTEAQIDLTHGHGGLSLKVRDIPAWVCGNCGKRLVSTEVADRINRLLDAVVGGGQGKRIR